MRQGAAPKDCEVSVLAYLLGQIGFIRDHIESIFLLIVAPIAAGLGKRLITARRTADENR